MTDHPLTDAFEVAGEWFLPNAPTRQVAGTLRYSAERCVLALNEVLELSDGPLNDGNLASTYDVVHGITVQGEAVTLLSVVKTGASFNIGSAGLKMPESFRAFGTLLGAHVTHDTLFPSVAYRIPGLQVWLAEKVFDETLIADPASGTSLPAYRILPRAKLSTPAPAIDATLVWSVRCGCRGDPFTSVSLSATGWVTVRPNLPQPLEWFCDQQRKLTPMLTFLAGAPMTPDLIEAAPGQGRGVVSVLLAFPPARPCSLTNMTDIFMPRTAMGAALSAVVARWFEVYPTVDQPSQLAVSVLASEGLWMHVKLLSLLQALEGFHRALYEGCYMDDKAYEDVKRALCQAIPANVTDDHKDALRSRIRYGNQISLKKRLDRLADSIPEPLRSHILGDAGKVPRKWIDTRNYYTHWDDELRPNILDGQEMYFATVRMEHFLVALYLDLMGVPYDAIARSLASPGDFSQRLAQVNNLQQLRTVARAKDSQTSRSLDADNKDSRIR